MTRAHGTGSVYRHGRGYQGRGPNLGNGRPRVSVTGATRREADARLRAAIELEKNRLAKTITVGEWVADWELGFLADKSPSTHKAYRSDIRNHILPEFGGLRLDEVSADHVAGYLTRKSERLQPATINRIRNVLSLILQKAVQSDRIVRNVIRNTPRRKVPPKVRRILTRAELKTLVKASKKASPHHMLLVIMASTGLRVGEACALQWRDVTLAGGNPAIRVSATAVRTRGGIEIREPKTRNSRRTVPISGWLANEILSNVPSDPDGFIVPNRNGHPTNPDRVRIGLHRICRMAGLPDITPHVLRHTFSSLMLVDGYSISTLSKRLGHSSIMMTVDLYGHLVPDDDDNFRRCVDRAIGRLC